MTAEEYRDGLQSLGLTQIEFGHLIEVSPRTAQAYALDGPSGPAAAAMRLMLAVDESERATMIKHIRDEVDGKP